MKKKTKILTLFAIVFLLAFAVPFTGSAASPKAQAKKSVNTFLKYAKNLNTAKMEKCYAEALGNTEMYPDMTAFRKVLRPYTRKLQWQIRNCKVKGNQAVVKVNVTYANLHVSYRNVMDKVLEYSTTDFDASVNSTIRNMAKWLNQEIAKNGVEISTYKNIKIRLKKIDGKWKILDFWEELTDALNCGFIQGFDEWGYNMTMFVD